MSQSVESLQAMKFRYQLLKTEFPYSDSQGHRQHLFHLAEESVTLGLSLRSELIAMAQINLPPVTLSVLSSVLHPVVTWQVNRKCWCLNNVSSAIWKDSCVSAPFHLMELTHKVSRLMKHMINYNSFSSLIISFLGALKLGKNTSVPIT